MQNYPNCFKNDIPVNFDKTLPWLDSETFWLRVKKRNSGPNLSPNLAKWVF